MTPLQTLLYRVPLLEVVGDLSQPIRELQFDSRQVQPGDCFVALKGSATDGHQYIPAAVVQGAVAVVCEVLPEHQRPGVTYLKVRSAAQALGHLAANYFGNPTDHLSVVGVTGTNGKTTTVTLLYQLFTALGFPVGLIGTVESRVAGQVFPATHTTPDPLQLQRLFHAMVQAGCSHAFMEVSSHAAHQHRIAGIRFSGGVFTNITHDHLDYHGTFANYLAAKQSFFDGLPSAAFALTNADDRNGRVMVQNTRARTASYALKTPADYKARLLEQQLGGLLLEIDGTEVWCRLSGAFNAANLMAVYGAARLLGLGKEEVLVHLSEIRGAEGRFEVFPLAGGVTGIVDYAHTPDALENLLRTVRATVTTGGEILVVFGCGGDRDAAKRPEMGSIAAHLADRVILTSDNPRSEDPQAILDAIDGGIPISHRHKRLTIADRREAIRTAGALARPGDVIVVAGKGHETYQIIGNQRLPFDDRQELLQAFAERPTT